MQNPSTHGPRQIQPLSCYHSYQNPAWKLRASRYRVRWGRSEVIGRYPGGFFRRRRTVHQVDNHRLRWLAGRRTFFRQALHLGLLHLGRGVFFDPAADCRYVAALDAALEVW